MKQYPLPKKYLMEKNQKIGTFLENRGDRFHCGVDLYAPKNTPVFAVEDGIIYLTREFTNPNVISYWNTTYEIILQSNSTYFFRYAELHCVFVKKNDVVSAGDIIGVVGQVLNPEKINQAHPVYIQRLAKEKKLSMLHFEMYQNIPEPSDKYLGGNWFGTQLPKALCDPTLFVCKD